MNIIVSLIRAIHNNTFIITMFRIATMAFAVEERCCQTMIHIHSFQKVGTLRRVGDECGCGSSIMSFGGGGGCHIMIRYNIVYRWSRTGIGSIIQTCVVIFTFVIAFVFIITIIITI